MVVTKVIEENDADCYQPRVKKTKAKKLNDILSKHSGISSTAIQTPNILNHINKKKMFLKPPKNAQKLSELKNCQDTFPPSSVEAERCFSLLDCLLQVEIFHK